MIKFLKKQEAGLKELDIRGCRIDKQIYKKIREECPKQANSGSSEDDSDYEPDEVEIQAPAAQIANEAAV